MEPEIAKWREQIFSAIDTGYLDFSSYHIVQPVSVGAKGSNVLVLITISVDVPGLGTALASFSSPSASPWWFQLTEDVAWVPPLLYVIILSGNVLKSISQTCNRFEPSSGSSAGKGRKVAGSWHTVGLQSILFMSFLPKTVSLLYSHVTKAKENSTFIIFVSLIHGSFEVT